MNESRPHSAWLIGLLLTGLVALAVLRSAVGTRLDSFTIDEPWHAVAGASYVQRGDFALNPEHPPLVKLWVGTWLGDGFVVPPTPALREKQDERAFVETTMYRDNDDLAVQARTRAAMWSFNALLLLGIAGLLWRAFGPAWAVGTMAWLAIDPSVGAYLPVVMTDLPVALTLVLAALATGLLLATWHWRWAAVLALALGLALSSKHSALPGLTGLAGFAFVGWLLQMRQTGAQENFRRLSQLATAGLLAVLMLWAQYGMRFHPHADGSDGFNREMTAKIEDLHSPQLKRLLHLADDAQLLPRAYLWGLADTVRAGVEGRGEAGVMLWGGFVEGRPPWYTWPSLIAIKPPLFLLLMSVLGIAALWRSGLSRTARWSLAAVLAMGASYLASLMSAHSAYAGARHAMPVLLVLAIFAGALAFRCWNASQKSLRWVPVALCAIALVTTVREPRLWEYHNELAGGSANAHKYFSNESLDLGQRLHEVRAYYEREIAPGDKPVYLDYWAYAGEHYVKAKGLRMRPRVESIHDDNVAGLFDGWFLKESAARLPRPHYGYDPAEALVGLAPVVRFGNVELWRGRQTRPRSRDWDMFFKITKYVYSEGGNDWDLVVRRAQEIVARRPEMFIAAIELGNAHLRLGDRAAARKAYADALAQEMEVPELTRAAMQAQIARLDSNQPLTQIPPLRNPMME